MGIRLQRGTHTTQRKKATKVEKVKVKSQFNCNCSQTQAEQANQREKVNFAAGLLENTTKMKMKMKYSPISMVVALWCSRSLSLPLKREWVHYAWVKLLLLKPLFIVTLDFIWRFATTVLVVGGWWFSSLFIFFPLQTEPSYFGLFWAFPVLHHHHHHRSSIFLSTAVNRKLRQIINKGTPIFCCCFLQRVEVVRQILALVIQQEQQQQQLTAFFSFEKQCKWENTTTVQTHNTFSCYFCCTFVQQQQQLDGFSASQLLLERQIVLQLAQFGAGTAKHSQFSSERWIEFEERI